LRVLTSDGSQSTIASAVWLQREIALAGRPPGFHLITDEVVARLPELEAIACGLLHVFIKHTTASLTINENIAPAALRDFRTWFERVIPENALYWTHTDEGPDDMPAHIKASLLCSSVTLPVRDGRLLLGAYQGIFLCEHTVLRRERTLVLTLEGRSSDAGA
jgi:secondary thiamine-phosphate synthase enzyme